MTQTERLALTVPPAGPRLSIDRIDKILGRRFEFAESGVRVRVSSFDADGRCVVFALNARPRRQVLSAVMVAEAIDCGAMVEL